VRADAVPFPEIAPRARHAKTPPRTLPIGREKVAAQCACRRRKATGRTRGQCGIAHLTRCVRRVKHGPRLTRNLLSACYSHARTTSRSLDERQPPYMWVISTKVGCGAPRKSSAPKAHYKPIKPKASGNPKDNDTRSKQNSQRQNCLHVDSQNVLLRDLFVSSRRFLLCFRDHFARGSRRCKVGIERGGAINRHPKWTE